MIARIWRADATVEGAARYRQFFEEHVLPRLRDIQGFGKAELLMRQQDEVWTSRCIPYGTLSMLSGPLRNGIDRAVVEPEARAALRTFDSHVWYYDIVEYHP